MKRNIIIGIALLTITLVLCIPYSIKYVGCEVQVIVKVSDYSGRPLPNALVHIKSNTTVYESTTNAYGLASFDNVAFNTDKPYIVEVYYKGICVANETKQGTTPQVTANVYDITIFTWDLLNRTINPIIRVRSLKGTYYNETKVDSGYIVLVRVPVNYAEGTKYSFTIIWQGVVTDVIYMLIAKSNATQPILLRCSISDLRIEVKDIEGSYLPTSISIGNVKLPGIRLEIKHPNGTIITANSSTIALSRVPCGKYFVQVKWWGISISSKEFILNSALKQPLVIKVPIFTAKFRLMDENNHIFANTQFSVTLPRINEEVQLTTDENGEVVLSGIVEGTYTFKLTWLNRDYVVPISIYNPGTFDIRFPLVDISLKVVTKGGGGVPLSNAEVEIYTIQQGNESLYTTGYTDNEGYISFSRVPRGQIKVKVIWNGIEVASVFIDTRVKTSETIKCYLYSGKISLRSRSGRYLAGAQVVLTYPNGTIRTFSSNELGEVNFGLLSPGNYKIKILWKNVEVAHREFVIPYPTSPSGDYEDTLTCEVYDLTIHVVNFFDKPISGARVIIFSTTGIKDELYTRGGVAEFTDLPYGDYTVEVYYLNKKGTISVTLGKGLTSYSVKLDVLFALDGYAFSLRDTILLVAILAGSTVGIFFLVKFLVRKISSIKRRPAKRRRAELFVPFRPGGGE